MCSIQVLQLTAPPQPPPGLAPATRFRSICSGAQGATSDQNRPRALAVLAPKADVLYTGASAGSSTEHGVSGTQPAGTCPAAGGGVRPCCHQPHQCGLTAPG